MKIFCIGIGGIGMSAIAQIFKSNGHDVLGADMNPSQITEQLKDNGIQVHYDHSSELITTDLDLVIYSEAISTSNPQRVRAEEVGIKTINYAEALGEVSKGKKTIAITGTHGKTTVTGMLTTLFKETSFDPTIVIGSKSSDLNNQNFRSGAGEYFLTEACEYRENFKYLSPSILLINNLEPDHLDYFKTSENYYSTFQRFAEKVPVEGFIIVFAEDLKKLDTTTLKAKVIVLDEPAKNTYKLQVPGTHNQHNALAAIEVAKKVGITEEEAVKNIQKFPGTWRRFEYKGDLNGAKLYDDYGHHPTEVKATIQAAREWYPDKHLTVIFQPHQYSRTREFFNEFTQSFSSATEALITDIYEARDSEEDKAATSAEKLAEAVSNARYIPLDNIVEEIKKQASSEHIFLVMGAGNITKVFGQLHLSA